MATRFNCAREEKNERAERRRLTHRSGPDKRFRRGAVLAAGIGSFALAVLACVGDKSAAVKIILAFYKPTGPLSGVTTTAILIWFFAWGILEWRWRNRTVAVGRISAVALALLGLSLLLTFPLVVDLF